MWCEEWGVVWGVGYHTDLTNIMPTPGEIKKLYLAGGWVEQGIIFFHFGLRF